MKKKLYYALETNGAKASLNIFGDITSWPWLESDVSAYNLSKKLDELTDVSEIDVYINSYGGEVAEGLAIYNALKRHKAKVVTHCEGFACSIASVIFMAGDERVMSESSLLMVHNAWSYGQGNAADLRKQADDLDKITQASITAYKAHSNLSEDEIKALLDAETWILPEEALEYGFATAIEKTESDKASQNARAALVKLIKGTVKQEGDPTPEPRADPEPAVDPEPTPTADPEQTADPEPEENPAIQMLEGFFRAITS
jgi:ATP-dependent Clp protease protease subunit